jgi:hypothetical protein
MERLSDLCLCGVAVFLPGDAVAVGPGGGAPSGNVALGLVVRDCVYGVVGGEPVAGQPLSEELNGWPWYCPR